MSVSTNQKQAISMADQNEIVLCLGLLFAKKEYLHILFSLKKGVKVKMDCRPTVVPKSKARKRAADPENWKQNKAKKDRYTSKMLPDRIICTHKKTFRCNSLTMNDITKFHAAFYKIPTKQAQDTLILKYTKSIPAKRKRSRTNTHKNKTFTTKFYIPAKNKPVLVCQKVFLSYLNIKKHRVLTVIRKHFETGECPTEKRGGDHRSHKFIDKRNGIKDFIQSLNCSEPHYCRGSSSIRRYLPAELNINKLYKMYKDRDVQPIATKALFRKVFNTEFNLGFGSPKTDICSTCLQFQEKIKVETDINKKTEIMTLKRVHSLRAKAFYDLLKSKNEGIVTFSFDCQKNQPVPKLPDQSTYYSRQFYVYNLTIVQGSSKDKLTKENVFSYVWGEEEYSKDSNTVASAVYHQLNTTDLTNIHTVRLFSDGCGGQNKNTILIGMCCKWLLLHPSIKTIEVYFPVTGHSYLPSDRVFGHIEREIKTRDVIVQPQEYHSIIANHSTVILMSNNNSNCKILDWKTAVEPVLKPPGQWHFKFMESKRIIIKRSRTDTNNVLVKGEAFYRSDLGALRSVCRRNKNVMMITPHEIALGVSIKPQKINDVAALLSKHYGSDWQDLNELSFYTNIINRHITDINISESEETQYCEPRTESTTLMV